MFVFVKSIKGCFQRGSFNDKHVDLSLLKDFYPFSSLKTSCCRTREKKETQFVKMLRLLHLMTFDPILKSAYEHLVIKDFFSIFFRLITISIQNLAWNEIFLHIKRLSCFPVVHIFSFLHSMTFDLISGLHMQIQTWHPPLWLCKHAKYYVKSGLTNVLKNANKTKNMHLFFNSDCQLKDQ